MRLELRFTFSRPFQVFRKLNMQSHCCLASHIRFRSIRSSYYRNYLETTKRNLVVHSSSELEIEALKNISVLERVKFGIVNRVFTKEELDLVLSNYPDNLVVLKCKAKYCRPCIAFVKRYTRLAQEFHDVMFLEIMGDESRETRMMMVDFEVKSTPTFRYYLHEKCITTSVGIKFDNILQTIQISKPMKHEKRSR